MVLLDAHSIGMLVGVDRLATGLNSRLRLRRASGTPLRVLEISGVDKLLDDEPEDPSDGRPEDRTREFLLRARNAPTTTAAIQGGLRELAIVHRYELAASLAIVARAAACGESASLGTSSPDS